MGHTQIYKGKFLLHTTLLQTPPPQKDAMGMLAAFSFFSSYFVTLFSRALHSRWGGRGHIYGTRIQHKIKAKKPTQTRKEKRLAI